MADAEQYLMRNIARLAGAINNQFAKAPRSRHSHKKHSAAQPAASPAIDSSRKSRAFASAPPRPSAVARRGRGLHRTPSATSAGLAAAHDAKVAPPAPPALPCKYFSVSGACKRGAACSFAHDPSRVPTCPAFIRGRCFAPSCTLAHRASELPVCEFFLQGSVRSLACLFACSLFRLFARSLARSLLHGDIEEP